VLTEEKGVLHIEPENTDLTMNSPTFLGWDEKVAGEGFIGDRAGQRGVRVLGREKGKWVRIGGRRRRVISDHLKEINKSIY